jgi:hypothetical protein
MVIKEKERQFISLVGTVAFHFISYVKRVKDRKEKENDKKLECEHKGRRPPCLFEHIHIVDSF